MTNQLTAFPNRHQDRSLTDRFIEPLARMRSSVDHMFEDFPARLSAFQFAGVPAVQMTEADDCYTVTVEIPGIPQKDIDLQIDGDTLILKGEKKEEREEKDHDYVISERSYGAFERRIAVPADGLLDDINAETADGVLRIAIPRNAEAAMKRRQIEIHTGKKAE